MPSSLAAALAASKKSGPAAASAPTKKKDETPRPSSLMQHQKKKDTTPASKQKKPQEKPKANNSNQTAKSLNKGNNINTEKKSPQKHSSTKKNHTKDKDTADTTQSKSPNRKGKKKKGGKSQTTPAKKDNSNHTDADAVVFLCDIPSDSDDSEYVDECDGVDDDYYDEADEDFEDGDCVDGEQDDLEEGECDDSDSDFDVVVVMDGTEVQHHDKHSTPPREGKGGGHTRGGRGGGRGGRSGRDYRSDPRGHRSEGRGNDIRGTPKQQHSAGRGQDIHHGGRGTSGHSPKDNRRDTKTSLAKPTNPASMPTPWSAKAGTMKGQESLNKHHQHHNNRHSDHGPRHAGGRHSNDRARDWRQHNEAFPQKTFKPRKPATSSFTPASTLLKPNNEKKVDAAKPAPKLEAATIKGRWADEDSSDED